MSQVPQINCPHCGQLMPLVPELAGQQASCPGCEQLFTVPAPPSPQGAQGNLQQLPERYADMRRGGGSKNSKWLIFLIIGVIAFNVICGLLGFALELFGE